LRLDEHIYIEKPKTEDQRYIEKMKIDEPTKHLRVAKLPIIDFSSIKIKESPLKSSYDP